MKLPNKTTPVENSVFPCMLEIVKYLEAGYSDIRILYKKLSESSLNCNDILDAFDCLYVLGYISLNEKGEIHYVEKIGM